MKDAPYQSRNGRSVLFEMARGVTYHNRNRSPAPCVSSTVVSGTLRRTGGSIAPEIRMKAGGNPADRRLPRATTSPQMNTATGANNVPSDAMPSVANNEALKKPSL